MNLSSSFSLHLIVLFQEKGSVITQSVSQLAEKELHYFHGDRAIPYALELLYSFPHSSAMGSRKERNFVNFVNNLTMLENMEHALHIPPCCNLEEKIQRVLSNLEMCFRTSSDLTLHQR